MPANDSNGPRPPGPTPLPWRFDLVRMDRINLPAEALRRPDVVPASVDAALRASIEHQGVLVPVKLRPLGDSGEYSLIDGSRRLAACKALGWAGDDELPAMVVLGGSDEQDVIEQIHVNQLRARLDPVAEAEGLRRLVQDLGWSQTEAAEALGKDKTWASHVMPVWKLPPKIVQDMRDARFGLSQAEVMARHAKDRSLLEYLHREALEGRSVRELEAKAQRIVELGTDPRETGQRFDVREARVGHRSRFRIETGKRSRRVELTLDEDDDWEEILALVQREIAQIRGKSPKTVSK